MGETHLPNHFISHLEFEMGVECCTSEGFFTRYDIVDVKGSQETQAFAPFNIGKQYLARSLKICIERDTTVLSKKRKVELGYS